MRVISDAIGLPCEDFQNQQIVDSSEEIFKGYSEVLVDDEIVDQFYEKKRSLSYKPKTQNQRVCDVDF